MQSKIEQNIQDIEDYIEGCKPVMFNSSKIIVEKEELMELVEELKINTPEEIKALRKIVSNKDAIINDAKKKAQALIDDAAARTNQMVSESEIVRAAYDQADEVMQSATEQAQRVLDSATEEANQIKEGAIAYTDDLMQSVMQVLEQALSMNEKKYNEQQEALERFYSTLKANRAELYPDSNSGAGDSDDGGEGFGGTGELNLDLI
jgi:vacuolar-type H+-ATPase subunit H